MHCHCVQLEGHGGWEEKDYLWACVDKPQAQFQRTTSNLGHNSHRASGQEEASGLLTRLINMEGRKVHIYCRHNLLASLISLSNICWLFLHLGEQRRRSILNLRTFVFFTAVMLPVCMQPSFSKDIRFHYAVLQLGCYRFNQGSNHTIATNHKYISTSICISHMQNLSSANTEQRVLHLVWNEAVRETLELNMTVKVVQLKPPLFFYIKCNL